MSTFFAERGRLWMSDGPWNVSLTERQAARLLSIFDDASVGKGTITALWRPRCREFTLPGLALLWCACPSFGAQCFVDH